MNELKLKRNHNPPQARLWLVDSNTEQFAHILGASE